MSWVMKSQATVTAAPASAVPLVRWTLLTAPILPALREAASIQIKDPIYIEANFFIAPFERAFEMTLELYVY